MFPSKPHRITVTNPMGVFVTMNEQTVTFRSHTALLLSTALPYLQPSYQHSLELVMKFLEFFETLRFFRNASGESFRRYETAAGESGISGLLSGLVLDLEGLLKSLSGVCSKNEKDFFDLLLNLFRAKEFYETYGDLLNLLMSGMSPENMFFSQDAAPSQTQEAFDLLKELFSPDTGTN